MKTPFKFGNIVTNKYISAEMAGSIADLVQNNPYYVQQLCYNVWFNTEHETSVFYGSDF